MFVLEADAAKKVVAIVYAKLRIVDVVTFPNIFTKKCMIGFVAGNGTFIRKIHSHAKIGNIHVFVAHFVAFFEVVTIAAFFEIFRVEAVRAAFAIYQIFAGAVFGIFFLHGFERKFVAEFLELVPELSEGTSFFKFGDPLFVFYFVVWLIEKIIFFVAEIDAAKTAFAADEIT